MPELELTDFLFAAFHLVHLRELEHFNSIIIVRGNRRFPGIVNPRIDYSSSKGINKMERN